MDFKLKRLKYSGDYYDELIYNPLYELLANEVRYVSGISWNNVFLNKVRVNLLTDEIESNRTKDISWNIFLLNDFKEDLDHMIFSA